jgi:hypothetical protein
MAAKITADDTELRREQRFEIRQRLFARKDCAFARFLLRYAINGARIARRA